MYNEKLSHIADIEVRRKKLKVFVNQLGRFYVNLDKGGEIDDDDPNVISASTLEGLKTLAAKRIKKATKKLSIEVWEYSGYDDPPLKRGVIEGIHAANGNLLVRWDGDSRSTQYAGYHGSLLRLTPKQREKFVALADAKEKAKAELEKFSDDHRMDGLNEARKALGLK